MGNCGQGHFCSRACSEEAMKNLSCMSLKFRSRPNLLMVGGTVTLALLLCVTPPWSCAQAGWPTSVSGPTGFADLGKAMSEDPGFPHGGSDVQKAEFIFLHMGVVANKYGLKAGSGAGPRAWVIRVDRNFTDPENADSLKGCTGYGNCGEWSYAFSEILGGAGVVSRPVFAAKTCTRDAKDDKFTDTDTTVIVEEVLPNGTVSRRVFDTFRAAYHSGSYIGGGQPNSKEL